ncbi:MAG: PAS domain S-box protein [bacterium]
MQDFADRHSSFGTSLDEALRNAGQLEQALAASEARFRAAMESSPIGMAIVATDGRFLSVNPALCEMLGYSREALLARDFQSLTHPDDLAPDLAQVKRLLAGEADSYELVKRYLRPDGTIRLAELHVSLVRDANRRPLQFFSQVQDITERLRAEHELRNTNSKLTLAMDIAKLGYWEYDVATDRFAFDDDFFRIFGTSAEREGGGTMSPDEYARRFLPPDSAQLVRSEIEAARAARNGNYRHCLEHAIRRADGSSGVMHVEIRVERDAAGRVVRTYGANQDVTERHLAERALRESEARFRQVVENIQEVFWMTDASHTAVLYVSPSYERIWGHSCESLYADPASWMDAVHHEDQERLRRALESMWASGSFEAEYRIVGKDGSIRWIEDRGTEVRDASGRVERRVGVAADVTDRRRAEEQFIQAQKLEAIGRLAGGVAHDFNNILGALMMLTEEVSSHPTASGEVRERTDDMTRALERAADLTRQLLAFSRRQVMQIKPIDVNVVVGDLAKMLSRLLGEDIGLELCLHPGALVVNGDAGMIEQVLMNLAINARDAMPSGGRLLVETATEMVDDAAARALADGSPGEYARIRVTDTGCGIAPGDLAHIFEPFFTTKELGKGTGLGLATVSGIVHQHRGTVRVKSEVGHGTTFDVLLPRFDAVVSAGDTPIPSTAKLCGQETVLIVEDERDMRRILARLLVQHGYRVIEAASGPAALRVWDEHAGKIDLLITDMVMPEDMSGLELAAALRSRAPGLEVILTSGYSPALASRKLGDESGYHYLQKPSRPHEMLSLVRAILDAPRTA